MVYSTQTHARIDRIVINLCFTIILLKVFGRVHFFSTIWYQHFRHFRFVSFRLLLRLPHFFCRFPSFLWYLIIIFKYKVGASLSIGLQHKKWFCVHKHFVSENNRFRHLFCAYVCKYVCIKCSVCVCACVRSFFLLLDGKSDKEKIRWGKKKSWDKISLWHIMMWIRFYIFCSVSFWVFEPA